MRWGLDRRGQVPRSAFYLFILLAVAAGILFFLRRNPAPVDFTLGGPLFNLTETQVESMLVTRGREQYRLDRQADGYWTLSGARNDFLDQDAVASLVGRLLAATGGRLLPGSEPEDRRYDFNGPEAIRLTLFGPEGRTEKLAVGTSNPVTGFWYGSGAGRTACFPVAPGLRENLIAVPASLQLTTLLPDFASEQVQKIEIWRGERRDVLERHQGRWWLERPTDPSWDAGSWFRSYTRYYHDREIAFGDRAWLLADLARVNLLIYESSSIKVSGLIGPEEAALLSPEFLGAFPWRRVVLEGAGLNPDPTFGPSHRLDIAFDSPLEPSWIPALRRGNLLRTLPEAIQTVSEPAHALLDSRALAFGPSLADSLVMSREDQVVLRAHRDQRPARPGERRKLRPSDFWLTDVPTPAETGLDATGHHGRSRNLMANLETVPTLRVLPPTSDPSVLKPQEQVRLVLTYAGSRGTTTVHIGFLDEDRLPAGSPPLALPEDGLDPVGVWLPGSGQLLQIPGHFITTARAWAR